jgi:predicted transcriptional regulator
MIEHTPEFDLDDWTHRSWESLIEQAIEDEIDSEEIVGVHVEEWVE